MTRTAKPRGTIRSVAEFAARLNLSAWTVSRAINGHPEVNAKTRERIRLAMDELGFRPNPFARGLRGSRTNLVGVSFIGLRSPIVSAKLSYLQEALRQHHLRCVLEVSARDTATEYEVIEDFLRMRVDGIVLCYSSLRPGEGPHVKARLPSVHADPHLPQTSPNISLDRRRAMQLLMEHLLELGHRSFGLLGIGKQDPWRWAALAEIAHARGLDPETAFVHLGGAVAPERSLPTGYEMAKAALQLRRRPTALITVNDLVAVGAIHALREAGLTVPRDMSITGFDNLAVGHYLRPTLTTIEQNPEAMMQRAVAMLLDQINGEPAKRSAAAVTEQIEPTLIIGESTGPVS
jgi:DNA-binding LacI/PurR family transcriptional regulator